MNASIVYLIGVVFLIIGIALTYYGSHLKSSANNKALETQVQALKEANTSLTKHNSLLIADNKQLTSEIEQYQKDSEKKEGTIKELHLRAVKSGDGISSDYDFFGAKRTLLRPGCIDVSLGPEFDVFNKMDALEKQKNYSALINLCKKQIKETPLWLTPYFYMGIAHAKLGNKARAIELFEYVLKNAPDDEDYAQAKDYLKKLKH